MSPGRMAATGTVDDLVVIDELGRGFCLQRGEIAGERAGSPPHVLVEVTARQQKCDQHDRADRNRRARHGCGLEHRHREREGDADADRHVHVDGAGAQRPEGRAEERLGRIGGGRQHDQR